LLDVVDRYEAFHRAFLARREAGRLDYTFAEFATAFGSGLVALLGDRVPSRPEGARLLHKNPGTLGIEQFDAFFPDAKLIFLLRDGHDVVNSQLAVLGSKFRKRDIAMLARDWSNSAKRILDYAGSSLQVRYEDLCASPTDELRRIARFVDLDEDEQWLLAEAAEEVRGSTHLRSGAESPGHASWAAEPKTEAFNPVGRWRTSWSAADRFVFDRFAGAEMARLGYR